MGKAKTVFIILAAFIGGIVMLIMPNKAKQYSEEGIKVDVTITAWQRVGRTTNYTGVYVNEKGQVITAKVIPNKSGVAVGDVLEGYYMPDKPEKVICYNGAGPFIIVKVLGGLFAALGVVGLIFMIKPSREKHNFTNF